MIVNLVLFVVPDGVGAVSYYNLLDNSSFAQYTDYVEDGSFESGLFNQGVTYGNWSDTLDHFDPEFSLVRAHTGVYSMYLEVNAVNTDSCYYNITYGGNGVLGADLYNVTFWCYKDTALSTNYTFYYSDSTSEEFSFSPTSDTWVEVCAIDDVNIAKYVTGFEIEAYSFPDVWIDDVSILVDDGDAQDSLTMNSQPWEATDSSAVTYSLFDLVDNHGRLDDFSLRCQTPFDDDWGVLQRTDYFDSDWIHYINCYVWSFSDVEVGIRCYIGYADGSYDIKDEYTSDAYGSWVELNFGGSWVDSGKEIVFVRFNALTLGYEYYLDDVGLWSMYEADYTRFTYLLSPSAREMTATTFVCYQRQTYQFYGYFANSTGDLVNNGTVSVVTSFGSSNVNMSLGCFNFTLQQRLGSETFYEDIGLLVSVTDSGFEEVVSYSIQAEWDYVGGGSSGSTGVIDSGIQADFVTMLSTYLVIGLPALLLGIVTKNTMAMIFGMVIGLSAGYAVGLVDIWLIILMGVISIVLLYAGRPR